MIAFDASVLIALLDPTDALYGRAVRVIGSLNEDFEMSALTRAEVLAGPARAGRAAEFAGLLDAMALRVHPVQEADAIPLADLRVATGLTLPDCCVLLVAERLGAIATFDDRLAAAATARGVRVER